MSALLASLHAAARPYLSGWGYPASATVRDRAAYPWPRRVPGPAVAVNPTDRRIRCTTLTASILMRTYPSVAWTLREYNELQIATRPAVLDAPVRMVERLGIGKVVTTFEPETLHLVQGWRDDKPPEIDGDGFDGHAFFVFDRGNGVLDLLESTSREGLRGPRWRTTTAAALHTPGKKCEFPAALFIALLFPLEGGS